MAQQESLGDLKLYRIPIPVTVAAKSQKQVALLARKAVKVGTIYRTHIYRWQPATPQPVIRILTLKNDAANGLGLPLPAGNILFIKEGGLRPLVYGKGSLDDKAVGQDVEIAMGSARGVSVSAKMVSPPGMWATEVEFTAANDRAEPVAFELVFAGDEIGFVPATPLARRNGTPLWSVTVPANGRATLRYRMSRR